MTLGDIKSTIHYSKYFTRTLEERQKKLESKGYMDIDIVCENSMTSKIKRVSGELKDILVKQLNQSHSKEDRAGNIERRKNRIKHQAPAGQSEIPLPEDYISEEDMKNIRTPFE